MTPRTITSAAPARPLKGGTARWLQRTQLKTREQDLHLLRRAAYGPTAGALTELSTIGHTAWLDRQLNPNTVPDPDGDAVTALHPLLSYSPTKARESLTAFTGDLLYAMAGNTIGRSVWSSRQLQEVMVAFWNDHLHIHGPFYQAWDSRHRYDLDVIRPHALGSFASMLQAAVRHPAMLQYLDQNNSRAKNPNENLGRELLELHTVGSYTEADVLASARLLTGLSVGENGEFLYRSDFHYVGPLTILGWSHPNSASDGQVALTAYLNFLARHPNTAARIARKLAVRFVSDNPSTALVNELARLYLANDTKVGPVLRYLFTCEEFLASAGQKVRTPQEDLYAQLRALGFGRPTTELELRQLYWTLEPTGHAPMNWAPPNGFPDTPQHWATPATALARLSMHLNLSAGWWPKLSGYPQVNGKPSLVGLLPDPLPATHGELVQVLAKRLLFAPLPDPVCAGLLSYFGAKPADPLTAKSSAIGWQLPYAVALLFDAPQHSIR